MYREHSKFVGKQAPAAVPGGVLRGNPAPRTAQGAFDEKLPTLLRCTRGSGYGFCKVRKSLTRTLAPRASAVYREKNEKREFLIFSCKFALFAPFALRLCLCSQPPSSAAFSCAG